MTVPLEVGVRDMMTAGCVGKEREGETGRKEGAVAMGRREGGGRAGGGGGGREGVAVAVEMFMKRGAARCEEVGGYGTWCKREREKKRQGEKREMD